MKQAKPTLQPTVPVVAVAPIPVVDVNQPLYSKPNVEEVADEVMAVAKRQWYMGIVVFCLFLIVVGVVAWGYYVSSNQTAQTNLVEVNPTLGPSVTPAEVKIKPIFAVWNGSGVAGVAGRMAEKLTDAGYEVVETKNAPKKQTGTTVVIANVVLGQKDEIMQIVGVKDYLQLAEEGVEYNVLVIIGN